MKQLYLTLFFFLSFFHAPAQSLEKNVEKRLEDFFANYQTHYADIGTCRLDHFIINHQKKTLAIYANAGIFSARQSSAWLWHNEYSPTQNPSCARHIPSHFPAKPRL